MIILRKLFIIVALSLGITLALGGNIGIQLSETRRWAILFAICTSFLIMVSPIAMRMYRR